MNEHAAGRAVRGLIRVTIGGAQLRPAFKLCQLCHASGRCRQLARLEIMQGEDNIPDQTFIARRHCDGQAIFAGIPEGPRIAASRSRSVTRWL